MSSKSLSFLKPLLVVILALHFGHSAPHFRMLSFTQAPQNRWRHSGMTCGSEKVSRQMEHSKLLSTKDVSLDKANLRWSLLVLFWTDMLFQLFVASYCINLLNLVKECGGVLCHVSYLCCLLSIMLFPACDCVLCRRGTYGSNICTVQQQRKSILRNKSYFWTYQFSWEFRDEEKENGREEITESSLESLRVIRRGTIILLN